MLKTIALAVTCCLALSLTAAQEKKAEQQPGQPPQEQMDPMMAKWKELSTPGEAHKKLSDFAGVWETETRMWMGGEGSGQPAVTKGKSEHKMILGGRFLLQEFKGEMMGMPMTGWGLTGYDNYAKKYIGIWVDDMSTVLATMEGTMDKSGTVLTMFGKMDEWMTGELGKTVKYVTRFISKDRHVFEIHDMSIGEPNTKVIEVTYMRKK